MTSAFSENMKHISENIVKQAVALELEAIH